MLLRTRFTKKTVIARFRMAIVEETVAEISQASRRRRIGEKRGSDNDESPVGEETNKKGHSPLRSEGQ